MNRLCNVLVLIFAALVFSVNASIARDFSVNTSNPTLTAALNQLESIGKKEVINVITGKNSTGKPIKILFRNLAIYGSANCEAVTAKTKSGSLVILINNIHQNAPIEAIACLIAHESVHHTNTGTFVEELQAWTTETMTWIAFTNNNPELKASDCKLTKRLNYLAKLYSQDDHTTKSIEDIIATNSAYQNLK